ncbi:MAG: hypothetical protein WDA00_06425 [Eubacteriales bacterium]
MRYLLFEDGSGYCPDRGGEGAERTVRVELEAAEGYLCCGGHTLPVQDGAAVFPSSFLQKGENPLTFSRTSGGQTRHWQLEPLLYDGSRLTPCGQADIPALLACKGQLRQLTRDVSALRDELSQWRERHCGYHLFT